jgi:hypothetical protein
MATLLSAARRRSLAVVPFCPFKDVLFSRSPARIGQAGCLRYVLQRGAFLRSPDRPDPASWVAPATTEARTLCGTHGPGIPTSRTVGLSRCAKTRIQATGTGQRAPDRELLARLHRASPGAPKTASGPSAHWSASFQLALMDQRRNSVYTPTVAADSLRSLNSGRFEVFYPCRGPVLRPANSISRVNEQEGWGVS